jgi:Kef-type K+ transport system membrane component KefB
MTTSLDALVLLLPLSVCVALTGLLTPIALSFILTPAFGFPLIHSFAAGAALSSTSLGTILTVLQPRVIGFDLRQSKLGVVLLSAAVMDDVVAFIFAKLLSIIGSGSTGGNQLGAGIGRTIGVTVGLAVVAIPISRWILKPIYTGLMARRARWEGRSWGGQGLILMVMAVLFIGMIAAAGYGGTSPLYGVYLAGLITSYLSRERDALPTPVLAGSTPTPSSDNDTELEANGSLVNGSSIAMNPLPQPPSDPKVHVPESAQHDHDERTFLVTFEIYLYPVMTFLLLPLFFGSIGYSIPFVALWTGETIWKGIVYAILMIFAKAICGLWLFIWPLKGRSKDVSRLAGWRAALFLGLAMVARGEIGLL